MQERLPNHRYTWDGRHYRNGVEYKMDKKTVEESNKDLENPSGLQIVPKADQEGTSENKACIEESHNKVRNLHENVQTVADIDTFLQSHPDAYNNLTPEQKSRLAMATDTIQTEAQRVYGSDLTLEDAAKLSAASKAFMNNDLKHPCSSKDRPGYVHNGPVNKNPSYAALQSDDQPPKINVRSYVYVESNEVP